MKIISQKQHCRQRGNYDRKHSNNKVRGVADTQKHDYYHRHPSHKFMDLYICLYLWIYICISMYLCMRLPIHLDLSLYLYICVYIYIATCPYVYRLCPYIHTSTDLQTYRYIVPQMYKSIDKCLHIHV